MLEFFYYFYEQLLTNLLTIATSVIFSIGGGAAIFNWLSSRNLQSQQATLNENLEQLKSKQSREIQRHYLRTEQKVTSHYKTFPEVHEALKNTEGAVYSLVHHSNPDQEKAREVWMGFTQVLAKHALFLSKDMCQACITAKDNLIEVIRYFEDYRKLEPSQIDEKLAPIHNQIEDITDMMRKELTETD
jgi:hypothetical protein